MTFKDVVAGVFRFVHVTAGCFVIGNSVSDVIWDRGHDADYSLALATFGIALLVSGIVNIILLKPAATIKPKAKQTWSYLLYGKAAIWVLFIPIPDLITEATGHSFPRKELNCALSLAALILSVICKTVRDSNLKRNLN
jgi:hypothetical protein